MLAVDHRLDFAEETAALIAKDGGACVAFEADVTKEATLQAAVAEAMRLWGRIDILHNNVGVSLAGGDATPLEITEAAFDRVNAINLRGTVIACKHVLPIMRQQRAGSIINIASIAALAANYPTVAYKTTKAGMIAYTEQIACQNAEYGVRCNTILPGLMDTPMAVDTRARTWGKPRAEVAAMRDAKVPLRPAHGHRLGRGQRGAVPGLRRGQLHHRHRAARRRRLEPAPRVMVVIPEFAPANIRDPLCCLWPWVPDRRCATSGMTGRS